MAAHHPHDAENDREDRLPRREHHRQGDEDQRSQIIGRAQQFIRADPDAIEEAGNRAPDEQPDYNRVVAVAQYRCGNHRNRRRVAIGAVGCGIAPAVEDHDIVDADLDAIGEARQEHRPGPRGFAGRVNEAPAEAGRIVHRIPQRGEIRQRHRAPDTGFGEVERRDLILRRRSGKRLQQRQDAGSGDHRLQQQVLDQAGRLQPPALAAGRLFRRRVLVVAVHSLIKPCWTASNTASPRV